MASLVSTFHDAAIWPEAWPHALKALTDAAGVAGAALIISNKSTGNVDEAFFPALVVDQVRLRPALRRLRPVFATARWKLDKTL
jgi:hypothetical protein